MIYVLSYKQNWDGREKEKTKELFPLKHEKIGLLGHGVPHYEEFKMC